MNSEHWLVLAILITAVFLFVSNWLRVDLVALLVLVALILTGLVTAEEAFSGFASPAVITVWAVFIISGGLVQSGIADLLADQILRLSGNSPTRLLVLLMVAVGVMSAFMNNIGAVAILMPAVLSIGRQLHISPSKLLMPLAFAGLLGGNMTLIGTPPNILASSILEEYGGIEPFAFFDFLPMGIIVLGAGILYMVFIGRRLLPDRQQGEDELIDQYPVQDYVTEFEIGTESPLIDQTLSETRFGEQFDLTILRVRHKIGRPDDSTTDRALSVGDVLLIEGPIEEILAVSPELKLRQVMSGEQDAAPDVETSGLQIAEITPAPRSRLVHQTLKEMAFRPRYGLSVLAMRHEGRALNDHLGDIPIDFGDSLLVQGSEAALNRLRRDPNFLLLDRPPVQLRRQGKATLAVLILAGVLITAVSGLLSTSTVMLIGALLMVLFGILNMDEAYRSIDWQAVFLIAGMLPLGVAMETTGTARLLADSLVQLIGSYGPIFVLAGLFLLTGLLTEVISNAAATVLMVPIAIDVALGVGVNPQTYVMATVLAASTSFLMPVGHQVNVIIYGPGGYKFFDYTRVGVGLNLLLLLIVVTILPFVWPL